MPFTRKQDSLLTCRGLKCAKTCSTAGNCTGYKNNEPTASFKRVL